MDALQTDWRKALDATAAARRMMVIGSSDVGKSHFARQALEEGDGASLIDLDPGQKMFGAPGTLGVGRLGEAGSLKLERFAFTGSTSPVSPEYLVAMRRLLQGEGGRLIANTSGLVRGLGVRLQIMTIEAVRPDLIVAITDGPELDPILARLRGIAVAHVRRPPNARRKGPGERRRARQQGFAAALKGAIRETLPADIPFLPGVPAPFADLARPVCAISDSDGLEMCIGVVESLDVGGATIFSGQPCPPNPKIHLGRMWAMPAGQTWHLLQRLQPSWEGGLANGETRFTTADNTVSIGGTR
jgi:hypothetical protein